MSQDDVQKIKDRLSIEEVVGSYIKLEKAGKNLKACCPFHHEKTPSFMVSPDRGTYYCFGCHKKGDIFSFVEEFEGVEFVEALHMLADRAGITITKLSKEESDKYDRLKRLLELTTKFFEIHLEKNEEVIDYLVNRGLSKETIREFRIGYIPKAWDTLYTFLNKKGFTDQEIEQAGLIKKGNKGKWYDRFRGRIIFPISDSSGKVVGFTGRIYGDEEGEAKYLNSPETVLFDKSRVLYGYDKAKSHIRKLDFSILVEGQTDLIMAHQAGYKNAVASSGTALTEDHLKMLARISDKIVIAYDSDGAGFRASEKAWQMALSLGMDVKIADIPSGKDPADLILESKEEWKNCIKNSKHIIEIIVNQILESGDERSRGKEVSVKLIPYLVSIKSNIDQSYFVKLIGDKLNINEDSIYAEIKSYGNSISTTPDNINVETKKELTGVQQDVYSLLFYLQSSSDELAKDFEDKVKEVLGDEYEESLRAANLKKDELIFIAESMYTNGELKEKVCDTLSSLKKKKLISDRDRYRKLLQKAESDKNEEDIKKYLGLIQEISKEING